MFEHSDPGDFTGLSLFQSGQRTTIFMSPRWVNLCCGVLPTWELNSAMSRQLRSLTLRCPAHYVVWIRDVQPTAKFLNKFRKHFGEIRRWFLNICICLLWGPWCKLIPEKWKNGFWESRDTLPLRRQASFLSLWKDKFYFPGVKFQTLNLYTLQYSSTYMIYSYNNLNRVN